MRLIPKSKLSKEAILALIDEYDILRMYYPADCKLELNRPVKSPFRKENRASFIIGTKYGCITYKDMGDDNYRGDIWTFVLQIERLSSFADVLLSIDKKFNLGLDNGSPIQQRPTLEWSRKPLVVPKPTIIQALLTHTNSEGDKYLAEYELTLKDMNLYSDTKVSYAKELVINKNRQSVNPFCLIYNLKNERGDWIKAYRPKHNAKWRSSIPFTEMHGIDQIKGCKTVVVTKSVKDSSVIHKFTGLCTTVIQAEDISAISEENRQKLAQVPNLYIAMDVDKKGVKVSHELTQMFKCKHINTPYRLLDYGENDFAGMVKAWGSNSLIEHFKNKNII